MSEETAELIYPGGAARLFVSGALSEGADVALSEGQQHYLRHVLRAREGDTALAFNGRDGEWRLRLRLAGKRCVEAEALNLNRAQVFSPDVHLLFAPIKKTPGDYVAQKASELGVRMLQPVLTRRTIVARVNLERLQANAIEAAEQSGRLDAPECRAPVSLAQALHNLEPGRVLFFCDEAGGAPMLEAARQKAGQPAAILTGPEGGFDASERALIRAHPQAVGVSLGPRILRADTAALAALALWNACQV